jgi:G:T-mismatch repair DNA endonuclease (very short patch repair protein)
LEWGTLVVWECELLSETLLQNKVRGFLGLELK